MSNSVISKTSQQKEESSNRSNRTHRNKLEVHYQGKRCILELQRGLMAPEKNLSCFIKRSSSPKILTISILFNSAVLKKIKYICTHAMFEVKQFFLNLYCWETVSDKIKCECNSWNWGLLIVLLIPSNLLLEGLSFSTARPVKASKGKFTTTLMISPRRLAGHRGSEQIYLFNKRWRKKQKHWQTDRRFFTLIVIEQLSLGDASAILIFDKRVNALGWFSTSTTCCESDWNSWLS